MGDIAPTSQSNRVVVVLGGCHPPQLRFQSHSNQATWWLCGLSRASENPHWGLFKLESKEDIPFQVGHRWKNIFLDLLETAFFAKENPSTVKILCMMLHWWLHVVYLSKPAERTAPTVNSTVNYGLQGVMRCRCRFISCDKCPTLWGMLIMVQSVRV